MKYTSEIVPSNSKDNLPEFSRKNYGVAVALSGIFGILGIHHFYLERWGMGIFDLGLSIAGFTLTAFGFWWGMLLIGVDVIHTIYVTYKLLVGEYQDGYGKIIPYPGQNVKSLTTPDEFV